MDSRCHDNNHFFKAQLFFTSNMKETVFFLQPLEINHNSLVADIVASDYRTADVFRKYGIGYCCGGKWPVGIACGMQGVDADKVQAELQWTTRTNHISNLLDYAEWDIAFLIDYIINIHHQYLKKSLPATQNILNEFAAEHVKKFPYLAELEKKFDLLVKQLLPSIQQEEEVLFPYIRQILHAQKHKEPYAALLIRTLRKPVEETMYKGHAIVSDIILSIRNITNQYTIPENVCISHKVVIAKLKELDNDLMQHLYLEQSVLFPRAVAIEKEVLDM
jgi:regulator of cell morphogenesis and NO signaling